MSEPPPIHLSPPPRAVPATLTIRVVLGSVLSQIGWIFVLVGLPVVWAFDPGGALTSAVRFNGELATAEGIVSGWRETSMSINEVRVFETLYDFDLPDGQRLSGASYQTGGYVDQSQRVTVEYPAGDPSISRIQGMRTSAGGLTVAFVLIFPLVGFVLAVVGMQKGLKARRLMSTGRLALGTLKSKEPTNTRVNEQTVYRLTFDFPADGGGTYEVIGKTHRPYELEDEPQERLVYDPRNPSDAALLDELPCRPSIDRRGDFAAEGGRERMLAALNLLAPGLSVLVLVAYVLSG
jgi:hypothetical protein